MLSLTAFAQDNTIRNGGEYYLYNTYYARCLAGNEANDGPALSKYSDENMDKYVWVAESSTLDEGWYWLRHKATGKYLQASNASGNTWSCWFAGSLNTAYNSYEWALVSGSEGYIKSYRGTVVNSSTKCFLGIDTGKEDNEYISVFYDKQQGETSTWQIVDANYPIDSGRLKLYTDELDEAIKQGETVYNNELYGKPDELAVALYNARSAKEDADIKNIEIMTTAKKALLAAIANAQDGKYDIWISGSSFGAGAAFTVSLENLSFNEEYKNTEIQFVLRNKVGTGALVYVASDHITIGGLTVNVANDTSHDYTFSFDGSNVTLYVDGKAAGTTSQNSISTVTSVGTSAEWTVIGGEALKSYTAIINSLNQTYGNYEDNGHGKYNFYILKMVGDSNRELAEQADYHFLATEDVLSDSYIDIKDEYSWIIFDNIRPSDVISKYLKYIKINGQKAVNGTNCRVAIYLHGAVVYTYSPNDIALYGYSGELYSGTEYTFKAGANSNMGDADNELNSFILKRGYMVCFSTNSDGSGYSRIYVADHEDKRIDVLPNLLKNRISRAYVRKWNWVSKKGWCTTEGQSSINTEGKLLGCTWFYTWSADKSTQTDMEYVPHKGHIYWPSWSACNHENATAILGYNEPDHSEQHSDDCGTTIDEWKACTHQPEFMASGLRIGSPSPTDASWLTNFIKHCDDMAYRCDFVAFHAYWGTNEAANSDSWWSQLNNIYKNTGRPIWLTEWNNGASWTTESWPSSYSDKLTKQKNAIKNILSVLDNANFIERYSLYNWDSYYRAAISWDNDKNSWWVTPCGQVYRDTHPSHAYKESMQKVPVGWFPSTKTDNKFSFKLNATSLSFVPTLTNLNGDYTLTETFEYQDKESGEWKVFYDNSKGRAKFTSTSQRTQTIDLDDCDTEALNAETLTLRMHITTLGGGDTTTKGVEISIPASVKQHFTESTNIEKMIANGDDGITIYNTSGEKVYEGRTVDLSKLNLKPNIYIINGQKIRLQ